MLTESWLLALRPRECSPWVLGPRMMSATAVHPASRFQARALSRARAASPACRLSVAWWEADLGKTTTDITYMAAVEVSRGRWEIAGSTGVDACRDAATMRPT